MAAVMEDQAAAVHPTSGKGAARCQTESSWRPAAAAPPQCGVATAAALQVPRAAAVRRRAAAAGDREQRVRRAAPVAWGVPARFQVSQEVQVRTGTWVSGVSADSERAAAAVATSAVAAAPVGAEWKVFRFLGEPAAVVHRMPSQAQRTSATMQACGTRVTVA